MKQGNKEKAVDLSLTTLSHNNRFTEIFENRNWIIQFLKKEYGKKDDKVCIVNKLKLFERIYLGKIISDTLLDIKHKNGGGNGGSAIYNLFRNPKKYNNSFEEDIKSNESEEIEKKIRSNYLKLDEASFIDSLIFSDFNGISKNTI